MISSIISRLVILVFGTLYPAYASYKAVRTKNVKEYVKWMMYWIVFALFSCAETFTDVFCSFWFPFYYEFKVILVLWLLSPATKGSSILYRKFVHPMLTKREQEIDEYIAKAKEQGYHTVLSLGSKGVNYATSVIMQTAIKGGGGLVNQLRRSYSLSDISADMDALAEMNRIKALPEDELDLGDTPMPKDPRLLRRSRGFSPRRSASGSGRVEMYFPEVDVNVRQRGTRPRETGIPLSHIRSNEDVSSGYSSAEMLYSGHAPASEAQEPLVRTSSVGSSRVTRTKVARGGATPKRPTAAEDNLLWSESEESDSGTHEEYFYDVPPAPHSEPVDTVPRTTLSQSPPSSLIGSDFKSHVPITLVCEPGEVVPVPEEVSAVKTATTSNSNTGLLEEQSALISSYSNDDEERRQLIAELLLVGRTNLQQIKSFQGEINTLADSSIIPSDISIELQSSGENEFETNSKIPYLDDLRNNETLRLDTSLVSKTDLYNNQQPDDKEIPSAKTQEIKSPQDEISALSGSSVVPADIDPEIQSRGKEVSGSDIKIPYLDDLKNNETSHLDTSLVSKTDLGNDQQPDKEMPASDKSQEMDLLQDEISSLAVRSVVPADIDAEIQSRGKEVSGSDIKIPYLDDLRNNETPNVTVICQSDVNKDQHPCCEEMSPDSEITVLDGRKNNKTAHSDTLFTSQADIDKDSKHHVVKKLDSDSEVTILRTQNYDESLTTQGIDLFPDTVQGDEILVEKSPSKNSVVSQETDDTEFFDTESDTTENLMAVAGCKNTLLSEWEIESPLLQSGVGMNNQSHKNNEISLSDVLKDESQFKHPMTDFIPISVNCEEMGSPGNVCKIVTQEQEDNEFFDTETDITQKLTAFTENIVILPTTSGCSEISISENQSVEKVEEKNVQKLSDEMSKEGRAGRYKKHPAPSPPPKSSMEALHLIAQETAPEGEDNLNHILLVPKQKSPSPKRERSGSKSPRHSPNIHKNVADDTTENKSSITVEQVTPTESVNSYKPGAASYTEKPDVSPSEHYYTPYSSQASPNQPRKETKSKQDTRFFSRILAKPKSQLASFFPFFSSREDPKPLSGALTTSLTSLEDMRAEERMRSSSVVGALPYMATPPEIPPRRRTPEQPRGVNIREMSHSPPRRGATSD